MLTRAGRLLIGARIPLAVRREVEALAARKRTAGLSRPGMARALVTGVAAKLRRRWYLL